MKVGGSSYGGTKATLLGAMIVASVLTVMVPVAASGGWWDPDWQYRDQIQIAEQPYYQVPLEIDAISLIDQGKLRQDLGDLRFVTTDDRELPYWIDPKTIPFTFQEDFEGDLSKWTLQTGGGFSIEGGMLRSSGNQNILLAKIPQLVNYTVETKIKLVGNSVCGLVIGFQSGITMYDGTHNTYYLVRLDGSSIKIYQYAKGWRLKWSQAIAISTDTWHDLKVEHLGSIIKVSLDGSEVGSWTQPWPTGWNWYSTSLIMNAESVGLMNYSGEAYWDDVTITTRPAKSRATVLMPSPVTEPTTIYMYYGNPIATSQSNIQSTFLFGDDFDDQVFDTNKWGVWSRTPDGVWTDEVRWVSEAGGRQEMTSPITGGQYTYVHTLDTFTGPAAFKTRFEKGGYMYRSFDLRDSPIETDRTVRVFISFKDSGSSVSVGVWTKDEGWVENKTLFGSFISRNYFGEYYLTIIRNADGTFTFQIQTEDEHTGNWNYTTTATVPLDVPLQILMYDHPWSGCRGWGVWERYQDDVRVLSSFTANAPPQADAGGPYEASEGDTVTLDASSSSDPDDNIVLYEWDLDGDGVFGETGANAERGDETGINPTFSAAGLDGPSSVTVSLRVTDGGGLSDEDTATIAINNVAPTLSNVAVTSPIDENDTATLTGNIADPGTADTFTLVVDWGDSSAPQTFNYPAGTAAFNETHQYLDDNPSGTPSDNYTISVTVSDDDTGSDIGTASVTVNNVAPTVSVITAPIDPVEVGTPINASASFSDPGTADTHDAEWDWGDDTTTTQEDVTSPALASHTYTEAGVYTVRLIVTDDDGDFGESTYQYVVVYDPDGGFVTGGGWINSPEGAYAPDPSLTGKATFGFVAKYKKGADTPTGQTEFRFRVADLNFHSDTYQWLVVAGHKAMFKGTGTINGAGNYGFMLSAIDEKLTPSTDVDLFRIKIWDKDNDDAIVYDNQMDADDDADPTPAIGGGSVVIHKK